MEPIVEGYYAELTEKTDVIQSINGAPYGKTAEELVAENGNFQFNDDAPTDFVNLKCATEFSIVVGGNITGGGVFGGTHPSIPTRPRP